MIDRGTFWLVVVVLGLTTYLIRFSFLGLLGNRPLPRWMVRGLRYTAVAVLPALAAPAMIWPQVTHGAADPQRLVTAAATLLAGALTRNMIAALVTGGLVFYLMPYLLGS